MQIQSSGGQPAAQNTSDAVAPRSSRGPAAWSQRVKQIALAPFRLHHYRDVHSRMLRDALCRLDCKPRARKRP